MVDWKEIWDANPDIFIASGWEKFTEEKRKNCHLSSSFSYYSAGDMRLRIGIIATRGAYKEEEFLLAGVLFANRLGNGARTVIYFVAQDFSPVFLGAIAKLGGTITAKAVYWREKLTPSLYPVQEKAYYKSTYKVNLGELRPGWDFWERQLNPVDWNHLKIIRNYFERLAKRRVKVFFEKNKIIYRWGKIEIAEVKKKGNKFELSTKIKWTRNKSIATKFTKTGWVDLSGSINEEFCRAIKGILELLEKMETNGSLEPKDQLLMKLMYDRTFIPESFGTYCEFPWLPKDRNDMLDGGQFLFFRLSDQMCIVSPVLEKPVQKVVSTLLLHTTLAYSDLCEKVNLGDATLKWNQKTFLLAQPELMDELRLCQSWLAEPEDYPIILLPEDWETEGLKKINSYPLERENSFY